MNESLEILTSDDKKINEPEIDNLSSPQNEITKSLNQLKELLDIVSERFSLLELDDIRLMKKLDKLQEANLKVITMMEEDSEKSQQTIEFQLKMYNENKTEELLDEPSFEIQEARFHSAIRRLINQLKGEVLLDMTGLFQARIWSFDELETEAEEKGINPDQINHRLNNYLSQYGISIDDWTFLNNSIENYDSAADFEDINTLSQIKKHKLKGDDLSTYNILKKYIDAQIEEESKKKAFMSWCIEENACYFCGSCNHLKKECSFCKLCKELGHDKEHCPYFKSNP